MFNVYEQRTIPLLNLARLNDAIVYTIIHSVMRYDLIFAMFNSF
jgi:hypothetical protein